MQSTFEQGPPDAGTHWRARLGVDWYAGYMVAWHAGWFLDAADGPKAIKEGREEQQFPDDVLSAALRWFHDGNGNMDADYQALGFGMNPYIGTAPEIVFAFEHFSRFETANRVWPPLVPATYWCPVFRHVMTAEAHEETGCVGGALTYRRDETAPRPTGTVSYVCRATPEGHPTLWVYFTV